MVGIVASGALAVASIAGSAPTADTLVASQMRGPATVQTVTHAASTGAVTRGLPTADLLSTSVEPSSMVVAGVVFILAGSLVRRRRGKRTQKATAGLV